MLTHVQFFFRETTKEDKLCLVAVVPLSCIGLSGNIATNTYALSGKNKVRLFLKSPKAFRPISHHCEKNDNDDGFVHVFSFVMQGKTSDSKSESNIAIKMVDHAGVTFPILSNTKVIEAGATLVLYAPKRKVETIAKDVELEKAVEKTKAQKK